MTTNLERRAYIKNLLFSHVQKLQLPPGKKVGALLLHGLTGEPAEMLSVAKMLKKMGVVTKTPLLPGHGGTSSELLAKGWKDWRACVQEEVKELCEKEGCDQVFIVGLCMGSLLPVVLAAENADNPKVAGIILLSATVRYDGKNSSNPFQVLLPLIDIPLVGKLLGRTFYWIERPPYGLKDENLQRKITRQLQADKASGKSRIGQFRTYAGSLRQFQHLMLETKKQAHKVKCPTLLLHSREDSITSVDNPKTLASWLTCKKRIVFFNGCDHVLTLDLKKEEVAYNCAAFIWNIARRTKRSDAKST